VNEDAIALRDRSRGLCDGRTRIPTSIDDDDVEVETGKLTSQPSEGFAS
jgi:hypothetical protein